MLFRRGRLASLIVSERPFWVDRFGPYAMAMGLTAVIALLYLQPWTLGADQIFSGGEDILYLQTNLVEAAQVGPFGTNQNLAYPFGDNLWSFPALGIAILSGGWLLVGVFGMPSAASALLLMALTLVATSGAVLFLFRGLIGRRSEWLAAALAAALAISPFFLAKVGHINVATIFVIPLALGILLRAEERRRVWLIAGAGVVFVGVAVSPLWWGLVLILLLSAIGVGVLLQRSWDRVIAVIGLGVASSLGVGIQLLLVTQATVPGQAIGRGPWASSRWGGQLTDLLVSSPVINELYPKGLLKTLQQGASNEFKPLGLVGAAFFVVVLLLLLKSMPQFIRDGSATGTVKTTLLIVISTVTLLFFFTGGLGNAQSAVAALLGTTSPARVFSRIAILVAMLGMAWFLLYFTRWRSKTSASRPAVLGISAAVGVCAIAFTCVDLQAVPTPAHAAASTFAEFEAVNFLRSNTQPCPVAQLPQDGTPTPRAVSRDQKEYARAEFDSLFYYRGYVPFLLAQDYQWSFGSFYKGSKTALTAVGPTLTAASVPSLKEAGFCAVLYDKALAESRASDKLEGAKVEGMPTPDFSSERFDVYLLK
jgi:hypothetical protein